MGKKWTDEQISKLLSYSKQLFETEIPAAKEISRLHFFLQQMLWFYKDGRALLELPKKEKKSFLFKVFVNRREKPEEIEVPPEAVWSIFHELRDILDQECDSLARLSNFVKDTE